MAAGTSGLVFDYTSLDFPSVVDDLTTFAQTRFSDEAWTDFNASQEGMRLIELMAYVADLLSFTANAQILETLLTTAVREENFRRASVPFAYTLKPVSPATVTVTCTLDPVGAYPFTISSHVQFATSDGDIVFQPLADVAVAAYGGGTVDVDCVAGTESYQETLGTTEGTASQEFSLSQSPLLEGYLAVSVGSDTYTRVTFLASSASTDKVFKLSTNEDGETSLVFGDGVNGVIPPRGQTVTATYRYGGGDSSNVHADTITSKYGTSDGNPFPPQILSVTNDLASTGGGPKQSLATARKNAPLVYGTNDRAVTLPDFAALAVSLVANVYKASAINGPYTGGASPVYLYIVPQGGGAITDGLRNQIAVAFRGKKLAGKRVRSFTAEYVSLKVSVDMVLQTGSPAATLAAKGRDILLAAYGIDAVDFGSVLPLQEAYDTLSPTVVSGISRVLFRTFTIKPYFGRHAGISTTGNGDVVSIEVEEETVLRREWRVKVVGPSGPVLCKRFEVYERRLGTVTSATDTLLEDEQAAYVASELVGDTLVVNPYSTPVEYTVTANTQKTISVASGLLVSAEPDDKYVVQRLQTMAGKVLRTRTNGASVAVTNVVVDSSSNFQIGDEVRFTASGVDERRTISAVPDVMYIMVNAAVSCPDNTAVDFVWVSDDGTVRFSLVHAQYLDSPPTNPIDFVVGDELYVDTFEHASDLVTREHTFPTLDLTDLTITTVGGVR